MRKKVKKINILIYIFIMFLIVVLKGTLSYAVSGTPGSTVTVTYNIGSPDGGNLSTVTGKIEYDTNLLEYVSISSSAGYADNKTISAIESQINGTSMSVTVKYKIKAGISESITTLTKLNVTELYTKNSDNNYAKTIPASITVTKTESVSSNDNNEAPTQTTTTTTPTTTTVAKSSNANLSNLGITPNDFTGFKPGTTAYNVTVPNDVEQITVYANLQDSKASLTGTGAQKLSIGKNVLNVVVTAEDGTKKTYTINVTREEESTNENESTSEEITDDETLEENQEETNNANYDLTKLEITGYELTPEFSPDIYEYTLNVNGDISDLDVVTEGANHNVSVEVVGNTDLVEGENIITILVYNQETNENSTYQIVVNKTNIDLDGLNVALNNGINSANKIRYIFLGTIIFIIVCIIIFIIARKRYKIKNSQDDIYEYDEEDMEKINNERLNLDDEDELFKRVNKEKLEEPQKVTTTTIPNSTAQDFKEDDNISNDIIENEEDQELKSENEFFRTSKSKKKGKHF